RDGALSLARGAPGTGSGGMFFICIGDQPALDFGATRNADGQGFAAFGRVIAGMDVVRAINAMRETQAVDDPYVENQILAEPMIILDAHRRR
ncbi:MAG: peptidylprolyl isomerase, partial [Gammaproteobacteria bacterium]|nr:peptidylprolyl isomerase [Gammaproteobacteria bacterium]